MQNISLKLPGTMSAKLAAIARQRGASKAAVVREALQDYLARDGIRAADSFAELAGEFIGCVGGPIELSYNKRYMKRFGK